MGHAFHSCHDTKPEMTNATVMMGLWDLGNMYNVSRMLFLSTPRIAVDSHPQSSHRLSPLCIIADPPFLIVVERCLIMPPWFYPPCLAGQGYYPLQHDDGFKLHNLPRIRQHARVSLCSGKMRVILSHTCMNPH